MSDSEIIWKFLLRDLDDSHPSVYLYCLGTTEQKTFVINKQIDMCSQVFYSTFPKTLISTVVKAFLNYKLDEYKKGNIKITSRYPTI